MNCGMRVAGIGTSVPTRILSSLDLGAEYGVDESLLRMFRTNVVRRYDADQESPLLVASQVAVRRALLRAGCDIEQIRTIVLTTRTPDTLQPASVSELCVVLGLNSARVYQLCGSSLGPLQALELLRIAPRPALVVACDINSRMFAEAIDPDDFSTVVDALRSSDAAGALVVDAGHGPGLEVVYLHHAYDLEFDAGGPRIEFRGVGVPSMRRLHEPVDEEKVRAALLREFSRAQNHMNAYLDDVACMVLSELGATSRDLMAAALGFGPGKVARCAPEASWVGGASVIFQLEQVAGDLRSGDVVLVLVHDDALNAAGCMLLRMC